VFKFQSIIAFSANVQADAATGVFRFHQYFGVQFGAPVAREPPEHHGNARPEFSRLALLGRLQGRAAAKSAGINLNGFPVRDRYREKNLDNRIFKGI